MKRKIKKILIMILYIGIISISTKVYATSGTTLNETTRLRKSASTNSEVITLISKNSKVEIVEEEGEWYKVTYSNNTGYIRKDMISVEEKTEKEETPNKSEENNENQEPADNSENSENNEETQNEDTIQIGYTGKLASNIEVKILPTINSTEIAKIEEKTEIKVENIINKWCYIEAENNSGWVLSSKVEIENSSAEKEESSNTENKDSKKEENSNTENKDSKNEEKQTEQNKPETSNKNESNKEEESKKETTKQNETKTTNTASKTNTTTSTATKTKYVSVDTLNVRKEAKSNANVIKQLSINTQVKVIETVNSTWSKINVNGTTGYVASKYLSDKKTETSSRSESTNRATEAQNKKTETKATSTPTSNTTTSKTTNTTNTATNESAKSTSNGTTGSSVVQYAKQYLGYRYVYGGTSPSTGFDCSGFTSYVYKHFGKSLSRTASAQSSNGTSVSRSNLKEGDLVLFGGSSGSGIGHVGIYIGGNSFIHAANSKKGVIISSLSETYYAKRYVTARRIIN